MSSFCGEKVGGCLNEKVFSNYFSLHFIILIDYPDLKCWLLLSEVKNNPILGAGLSAPISLQIGRMPLPPAPRRFSHRQGIEVDRALFYMACPDFFPFLKLNLSAANEITLWWEIQMCGLTLGLLQ
jgi:hypothetical protein